MRRIFDVGNVNSTHENNNNSNSTINSSFIVSNMYFSFFFFMNIHERSFESADGAKEMPIESHLQSIFLYR